jgi:hypothetical protein
MPNEFEDACEIRVLQLASEKSAEPVVAGARSQPARLVARLYTSASASSRSRLLTALLRPLSPLALVGVASGAFAGFVGRGPASSLDDLGRFSREQIFELARFVEEVSPEALRHVARALAGASAELSAFASAAALLLMRSVGEGGENRVTVYAA